jgi:sodium-dependent dicarboxylate transporter 2/3/5
MLCCLFACWAVLVFIFLKDAPPSSDNVAKVMTDKYNQLPTMNYAQKSVLASFLLLLFLWIGRDPQVVPGFGVYLPKGYFTDATSAMFVALLLFILPSEVPSLRQILNPSDDDKKNKSRRLMDWPTMQKHFPWSVVLLLGGGFALASGVKESGLSNVIGLSLSGLDGFPRIVLQLICVLVTTLITNIASNTVSASIFLPIVANLVSCFFILTVLLLFRPKKPTTILYL